MDAAVAQAHEHFGRLDVVVNNAGYGLFGMIEEVSEAQARAQIETNLFGALWVTQAALPILREQGSGHVIQVSSIGGVNAFPGIGLYHASKWGLEGFSQALARGRRSAIHVTLVEPTGYTTDWAGPSRSPPTSCPPTTRCARSRAARRPRQRRANRGDPEATGPAILELVDADEPPLRVFFGAGTLEMIRAEYEQPARELGAAGTTSPSAPTGGLRREPRLGLDRRRGRRRASTSPARGRSSPAARRASGSRPPARWPGTGAEVTLAVRDAAAGERVAAEIGGAPASRYLDLADQRSRRARSPRGVGRPAAHSRQQRGRDGAPRARRSPPRAGSCSSPPTTSATSRWRSACTTRSPADGARIVVRQLERAPALAGDLRRPVLRLPRLRAAAWPTGSPRPRTCCSPSARPRAGRATGSTPTR